MIYEFELGNNITDAIKNICYMKDEGAVDLSIVTKRFEKFCSGCKNFKNQAMSGRAKTVDFETVLQVIEANPVSST